ncbi:Putative methyltransferase [Nitrosotalea devaniterrae]|uniref:Methyltransferase n=1 Tax=Nitrosotalea devaniterrae TaxID=1078905 RepID=A0A128A0N2_9ARCH|nr:Putative methyltransferase [Candidatus Nitrosotalea devanaterra]
MSEILASNDLLIRNNCRVCNGNNLEPVISLGTQCISNFIDNKSKILVSPLEVVLCNKERGGCGLLQLKDTVSRELLYRNYWYKSGMNQTMTDALTEITSSIKKLIKFESGDIVVDIGSNDGTLLQCYNIKDVQLVGFEPAHNLIKDIRIKNIKIINDFFNYDSYKKEFGTKKAKTITSISMFYDLDNPNKFVEDIVKILDHDGIWIIQMNYLGTMLENNAFDNIVHEHLEYYSLSVLEYLLEKHQLSIFDVELNEINGGSFRAYIKHQECKEYHETKKVSELRDREKKMKLDNFNVYKQFAKRINDLKKETHAFIKSEVQNGKRVYLYGASIRGNTLLQFYELDNKLIKAAADRNPTKWGKKTVGTNIPIISEEQSRIEKPDYFFILPWYYVKEFTKREEQYLDSGGKFIIPLPRLQIISR